MAGAKGDEAGYAARHVGQYDEGECRRLLTLELTTLRRVWVINRLHGRIFALARARTRDEILGAAHTTKTPTKRDVERLLRAALPAPERR